MRRRRYKRRQVTKESGSKRSSGDSGRAWTLVREKQDHSRHRLPLSEWDLTMPTLFLRITLLSTHTEPLWIPVGSYLRCRSWSLGSLAIRRRFGRVAWSPPWGDEESRFVATATSCSRARLSQGSQRLSALKVVAPGATELRELREG